MKTGTSVESQVCSALTKGLPAVSPKLMIVTKHMNSLHHIWKGYMSIPQALKNFKGNPHEIAETPAFAWLHIPATTIPWKMPGEGLTSPWRQEHQYKCPTL